MDHLQGPQAPRFNLAPGASQNSKAASAAHWKRRWWPAPHLGMATSRREACIWPQSTQVDAVESRRARSAKSPESCARELTPGARCSNQLFIRSDLYHRTRHDGRFPMVAGARRRSLPLLRSRPTSAHATVRRGRPASSAGL